MRSSLAYIDKVGFCRSPIAFLPSLISRTADLKFSGAILDLITPDRSGRIPSAEAEIAAFGSTASEFCIFNNRSTSGSSTYRLRREQIAINRANPKNRIVPHNFPVSKTTNFGKQNAKPNRASCFDNFYNKPFGKVLTRENLLI